MEAAARVSRTARRLALERLESRELLAGSVYVSLEGQMLVIWGDDADNSVVLTYNSTNQTYQVRGLEHGGSPTTIHTEANGWQAESMVEFSGVREVAVLLNGGNDRFEVGSPEAVDTVINKWLSIDMGDGDDEVILGRVVNPESSTPIATRLRTGTSVNVNLGPGHDRLEIANAEIGLHFNVIGGDGDDEVVFTTEFTPPGASQPTLLPMRVRGSSTINLGGGEDMLDIRHAVFNNLRILDGAGPADISLYNLNIAGKLEIHTADEPDTVALDYVYAKNFGLNTNGGADDVDIRNCRFRTMNVKLGAARDRLVLRNVKVSLMTHLDGGPQKSSIVRGPGNQLRGLTQRNFG